MTVMTMHKHAKLLWLKLSGGLHDLTTNWKSRGLDLAIGDGDKLQVQAVVSKSVRSYARFTECLV